MRADSWQLVIAAWAFGKQPNGMVKVANHKPVLFVEAKAYVQT